MNRILIVVLLAAVIAGPGCANKDKREEIDPNLSAQQLYNRAKRQLIAGNITDALVLYQELESRYPYGLLTEQAQLDTAYAHYRSSEPALAVVAAERFIRLHPTHASVDYAYYIKGLAEFIEQRDFLTRVTGAGTSGLRDPEALLNSFNAFRELVTRFPASRYAPDSRQRMAYLLNLMAQHDVGVARFYLKRGAYVAVVNRAKYVIERYQSTPAIEDALGLMATAYQEMGLTELAQDTVRVLRENFPASPYLRELSG